MTYHVPGATWQNVWARSFGSTSGSAVGASTVPDVPQLATASPGATTPTPAAPHALSAPPPTTGVPAGSPVAFAAAAVTRPSTSAEPPTLGSSARGTFTAARISSLHVRRAGSNMSVPDASDGSEARSPVRRYRMKSFASTTVATRAYASGS